MIDRQPIAIVGVSAIFPGSADTPGFWNDVLAGRDLIGDVPPHYWLVDDYYDPDPSAPDKTYGKRGAFLTRVDFDTLEFGIPPAALPAIDSSQILGLVGAKRVLADAARGRSPHVPKDRVSVYLGVAATTAAAMNMAGRLGRPAWIKGMREAGIPERQVQEAIERIAACFTPLQENSFPGILSNVVAGRIANRFDLRGSNFTTDAACASSLAAISVAVNDLLIGNSDMVLTGGIDALNDIQMFMCFSKTPALSPTGDCRPYSSKADGTMLGEGLAMFALRRLDDAERDGDSIYAIIRGIGSSSDGLAKSVYAPRPEGQSTALRRAYAAAGYGPDTVELVEGHGTATAAGDQAEFEALREVFGAARPDARQWCALGSVKSQIGHTKGAAGAAGLFKTAMALHHKMLPPTIKVDLPNPKFAIEESPFYLNTEARPWIKALSEPRRASISSFGFGGTNFHIALEEYRGPAPAPPPLTQSPVALALVSASDPRAAAAECRRLAQDAASSWHRAARDSQAAFDASAPTRIAAVASSADDLAQKLNRAAASLERSPEKEMRDADGISYEPNAPSGPVAFLFSGQGSQFVGMGGGLAIAFDPAREAWGFAEQVLSPEGFSVRDAVFPCPVFTDAERERRHEFLTRTENAQPALAAAALAQLAVLRLTGLEPDFTAGHSFGELVALYAAGCFSAADLLRIARRRGELMAEGNRPGAMTAVSHSIDDLRVFLAVPGPNGVVIANHNAPRQAVLSGAIDNINAVEQRLSAASISYRRLHAGGAFHSPLMAAAVQPFAGYLAAIDFNAPSVPVFSNATAAPYARDPARMREQLSTNLTSPVLFAAEIDALYDAGARVFVEIGAGSVLRQLTSQCLRERAHVSVALGQNGEPDVVALWQAFARLSAAGVRLEFDKIHSAFCPIPAETPARSSSTVLIDGAGYERPYPPKGGAAALPPPNPEPVSIPPAPSATPHALSTTPHTIASSGIIDAIQHQIAEAQKASQAAILESLSITLKSLEAVARQANGLEPGDFAFTPVPAPQVVVPPPPKPESAPAPAPAIKPQPKADFASTLLAIVSEKTGYPLDVLNLDVELEAGLGIDSIKRVEIFSAIQQQFPALPEMSPASIGAMKTLKDILAFAGESAPAQPELDPSVNPERILLEIVSGKTGYPIDALSLDIELEGGLGIDSIKRVEIFSAIQQRLPEMPELQLQDAGRLRTLRDIIAFASGAEPVPPETSLQRRAVEWVESKPSGLPLPGLFTSGPISIVGAAPGLASRLESLGIPIASSGASHAVIDLSGCARFESVDDALAANARAFETARGGSLSLFVTVGATGGEFDAWAGGVAGIAKTFAREFPSASVKSIAIDRALPDIAKAIATELLSGGSEIEVALNADGSRLAPVLRETAATETHPRISRESVVLATGGARGVTAACLIELARAHKPRMALVGRTPLEPEPADCAVAKTEADLKAVLLRRPEFAGDLQRTSREAARLLTMREIRQTLRDLEQAGSECAYFAADMRDSRAVEQAVAAGRARFGPITALIHGAGTLADKKIADKTPGQFALVFETKISGLRSLLNATAVDPIDTICLFSSVAGRFGNAGQCDYSAANEVLTRVAEAEAARRGPKCLVRSIDWGPWDGGMVTAALAKHFRAMGADLIPLRDGARAFVRELEQSASNVEVVISAGGEFETKRALDAVEVLVNSTTYPFLDSHRIAGEAVLPVVLVNEWFHRFAESSRPGARVTACRDLKVVRGIPLPDFSTKGHLFRISANGIHCELRSPDGVLRYSATLDLGSSELAAGSAAPGHAASTDIYRPACGLFHGPDFHVIREIRDFDASRIGAILRPTPDMNWPSGPWITDAAAIDGAFQLIRLWGIRHLGGPSLPTRIGSFVRHAMPSKAAVVCDVRPRAEGNLRIVAHATFRTENGALLAEMRDIEMHLSPGA